MIKRTRDKGATRPRPGLGCVMPVTLGEVLPVPGHSVQEAASPGARSVRPLPSADEAYRKRPTRFPCFKMDRHISSLAKMSGPVTNIRVDSVSTGFSAAREMARHGNAPMQLQPGVLTSIPDPVRQVRVPGPRSATCGETARRQSKPADANSNAGMGHG